MQIGVRLIIDHKALSLGSSSNTVKGSHPTQNLTSSSVLRLHYPPKVPFVLKFCGCNSLAFVQPGKLGCGFDLPKLDLVLAQLPPTHAWI